MYIYNCTQNVKCTALSLFKYSHTVNLICLPAKKVYKSTHIWHLNCIYNIIIMLKTINDKVEIFYLNGKRASYTRTLLFPNLHILVWSTGQKHWFQNSYQNHLKKVNISQIFSVLNFPCEA